MKIFNSERSADGRNPLLRWHSGGRSGAPWEEGDFALVPPRWSPAAPRKRQWGEGQCQKDGNGAPEAGMERADEFSRPTEDGAGPQSPHRRPQSPQRSAHWRGKGGRACTPTAINSIARSLGPNSHRPHKWGLGSKSVQGLVGRARPHTGGGRLPGLPAPGRQLWGTAHPQHTPSVDPQNKREGGRRLRPPQVGDGPSPCPYFFSLSFFFPFKFYFPNRSILAGNTP